MTGVAQVMAQIGEDKEGSAPFLDGNKEIALFRSMKVVLPLFIAAISFAVSAQIPKNGTYTYAIAFAEWDGKSNGATCTVVIKGDSIKVIHNGLGNLTGKKGEILDAGIIMKHKKTGKYIIAHNAADADASQANGCEGPSVIDFDKKKFWLC